MAPVITITTSQGQTITVEFHKTAYKCWHVIFPRYVDQHQVDAYEGRALGDYVYTGPSGGAVLATSSLARGMAAAAEQITRTEF